MALKRGRDAKLPKKMTGIGGIDTLYAVGVLLDKQWTVDLHGNRSLLRDIRRFMRTICIRCNAGTLTALSADDLPATGPCGMTLGQIGNALSRKRVSKPITSRVRQQQR
jgi:hypothetical protein